MECPKNEVIFLAIAPFCLIHGVLKNGEGNYSAHWPDFLMISSISTEEGEVA
jgi:hypothetical protein